MMRVAAVLLLAVIAQLGQAQKSITVFAASSLKDSFSEIAKVFEEKYGTRVKLSFAGSQQLAAQINAGAPADVFASAAAANLDATKTDKSSRTIFAKNRLIVVFRKGSRWDTIRDLESVKRLVVGASKVPIGTYTRSLFENAAIKYGQGWKSKVLRNVVSEEQDVRSVLIKVILGEADAGVVYVSDIASSGSKVRVATIPESMNPKIEYPAAIVSRSKSKKMASQFLAFLKSEAGQKVMVKHGFLPAQARVSNPKPAKLKK